MDVYFVWKNFLLYFYCGKANLFLDGYLLLCDAYFCFRGNIKSIDEIYLLSICVSKAVIWLGWVVCIYIQSDGVVLDGMCSKIMMTQESANKEKME